MHYLNIHTSTHTLLHIYLDSNRNTYKKARKQTRTEAHTHTRTHTHTHTHTHTRFTHLHPLQDVTPQQLPPHARFLPHSRSLHCPQPQSPVHPPSVAEAQNGLPLPGGLGRWRIPHWQRPGGGAGEGVPVCVCACVYVRACVLTVGLGRGCACVFVCVCVFARVQFSGCCPDVGRHFTQVFLHSRQEAAESITFGRHVSNRLKIIYSESSCRELSIDICMGRIGGGGLGGVIRVLFLEPLLNILGHSLRNFKYTIGILNLSPVDWHPFWANWVKGGVCGHF